MTKTCFPGQPQPLQELQGELLLQGGNIQVSLSSYSSPYHFSYPSLLPKVLVFLINPPLLLILIDDGAGGNAFNKELKTPGWQKPLTSFFTVSNLILAFLCQQSYPNILLTSIFSLSLFSHLISQNGQRDPNAPAPKERTEEEEEEYQLMKAKLAGNFSPLLE